MFLGSFEDLRTGLLNAEHLRLIVQLGRHAFSEADPPGNAVLFLVSPFRVSENAITATRITTPTPADEQATLVAAFCDPRRTAGRFDLSDIPEDTKRYLKNQAECLRLPHHVLAFWIPDAVTRLFSGSKVADILETVNRTKTGSNDRFVRYHWEVRESIGKDKNWLVYQKGGDYCTYFGNNQNVIRWDIARQRYFRRDPSCRITDTHFTCREALTYTSMGRQFCGRVAPPVCTYDVGGASLVGSHDDILLSLAVLNSPVGSYIVKALNGSINIQSSDVEAVPLPSRDVESISQVIAKAETALTFRKQLAACIPLEYTFSNLIPLQERLDLEEKFVQAKNEVALAVRKAFGLQGNEASFPLPAETIWERLSLGKDDAALHEAHKDAALTELTVGVLQLLGHVWPTQLEHRRPLGSSFEANGIIQLCDANEVREVIRQLEMNICAIGRTGSQSDYSNAFAERVGLSMEEALNSRLAYFHATQFQQRPIIWEIQSQSLLTRSKPVYFCLAYYHKLHSDLVGKVRKMAEDLRKTRETELRGIIAITEEARSDRQEARRVELEDTIAELQRFDTTLETVATNGFGPESVRPMLRQFALDDAVLVVKARWLSRLSDLIFAAPLQDWVRAASQTEVHADFGLWITSAMSHLDHYCAAVGPPAPDQSEVKIDPTPSELAVLICPEAASMQARALFLGCEVWWSQLDETVFAPLKEQIKQLKAEQKECEATLKSEPEPDEATTRKLKARVKELKAKVKSLDKELKEQTTKAKGARKQIEAWKSDEPATWGEWLAEQPMFDRISSLDHRRPAPKTIAEFVAQESLYAPDINDGVRVNIAPLQKAGVLAADVLAAKDLDKAIADRAEWRSDERRWVREGKLPQPGWWPEETQNAT
jgi:hypothetical protein